MRLYTHPLHGSQCPEAKVYVSRESPMAGAVGIRQEFVEPIDGMRGDAREDIAEPDPGVDLHAFAGSQEGVQHRRGPAAQFFSALRHRLARWDVFVTF
jgi:hypothetical protein